MSRQKALLYAIAVLIGAYYNAGWFVSLVAIAFILDRELFD